MRQRSSGQEGMLPGYKPLPSGGKPKKHTGRNIALVLGLCLLGFFFMRSSSITAALGISAPAKAAPGFSSHAADRLAAHDVSGRAMDSGGVDDGSLVVDTDAAAAAGAGAGDAAAAGSHAALRPATAVDEHSLAADKAAPKFVAGGDLVDGKDALPPKADAAASEHHHTPAHGVYALSAVDINGINRPLSEFAGKVSIIVNVASKCGFTEPNYKGLQALYEKYKAQGLEVLAFPCDQFGGQEPGTDAEVKAFAVDRYHATFPLFAKVEVNGPGAHQVYQHLKRELRVDNLGWNFQKILVNRAGKPVQLITQAWDEVQMDKAVHALLTEASA